MARPHCAALSLLVAVLVSGCNSTQDVLEPSAINPASSATSSTKPDGSGTQTGQSAIPVPQPAPPAPGASPAPASAPKASASLVAGARIQFAPIVGTSVDAATALSERLGTRARERGMTLTGSTDTTTTHVMKGYFTPLTEGKQTTIIYVWDVYDPAGNRVHRISGQQKAPAGGKEGWDSVSPEAMRSIAVATIDELAAWLGGKAG